MALEAVKTPNASGVREEAPSPEDTEQMVGDSASVDRLIAHAVELYSQNVAQFKEAGKLVFLEWDLALSTLKWCIGALVLFSTAVLLTFTFLVVAGLMVLTGDGVALSSVLLMCAAVTAAFTCGLVALLRFLFGRMKFVRSREHFLGAGHGSAQ